MMTINQSIQLGATGKNITDLLNELKYVAKEGKLMDYYFEDKADEVEYIEDTVNMILKELVKLKEV